MLPTLQFYILKEMGRTALLTAIGLTGILALGGGVLNIVELEEISAGQLLQMMGIILPVAATLALPVATLYAAATTYGRLSADNEFVACRASGINIHRLLLPSLSISVFVAGLTGVLINYLIPNRVQHLDELLRSDAAHIVLNALHAPGRLALDRVRVYADEVGADSNQTKSPKLGLRRAAFIELDEQGWSACGTAKEIELAVSEGGAEVITRGVSLWNPRDGQWYQHEQMPLFRGEIPKLSAMRHKLKWLTLGDLIHYRGIPLEIPLVQEQVKKLRQAVAEQIVYRSLVEDYASGGIMRITDQQDQYELSASDGFHDPDSFKPTFVNVVLTVRSSREIREARAAEAAITVEARGDVGETRAFILLGGGVEWNSSSNPAQRHKTATDKIGPIHMKASGLDAFDSMRLLVDAAPLGLGAELETKRGLAIKRMEAELREIDGVIHSRLAFSGSILVLVILAAALGIIFRGAHLLTAFGISFIPSLFVIVMIIMGRQLSENAGTANAGFGLMWGAIALAALVDLWVLAFVLKR